MFSGLSFGQLIDEKNVTVTMDLQPVLQLHMTTPDQVDFVFDDIREYYSGIIKYAATILKVSSSVTWDLYAVGTSQAGTIWDQQMTYSGGGGANAISALPLSCLELHQYEANRYDANAAGGTATDYSGLFQDAQTAAPVVGQNSIFYSATPYTAPGVDQKYIQGHSGTVAGDDGAPGGSYLIASPGVGQDFTDYYFTIDYRIVPGLPAIFPFAGDNLGNAEDLETVNAAGAYANPGVYTMNVKYILLEDQ
ncbi:MAG: hypothetical protein CVU05_02245 [Bacteroidetes bacterium HGW-Bacteroidetes-21]|nr:MAG: hypothetical protein CVU05_02245 [Bacteroidetes bacterium HGW-Bacteroidetes-21]